MVKNDQSAGAAKGEKYLGYCQLSDVAWSNFSTDSHMSTYGISNELLLVFKLSLKCSQNKQNVFMKT